MDYSVSRIKTRGQVLIESSLFLVVMILLLLLIVRVWVWANNQMAGRQPAYNDTRVEAGTVANLGQAAPLVWEVYEPEELTREWVFNGQQDE